MIVALIIFVVAPTSVVAQGGNASEEPWSTVIPMDSLTKLREDSIRAFARRERNCKPDRKIVHQLARQEVTATDTLAMVVCGRVWLGMRGYFLFFNPAVVDRNRTVTKDGAREQWVLRYRGGETIYVYVEGNRVTAIQD
jgi:hypothetical protein